MRILMVLALGLLMLMLAATAYDFYDFLDTPVSSGLESFEIPKGASLTRVANELERSGVIESATYLRVFAKAKGTDASIQAGEYAIDAGLTPREILDKFVRGDVRLFSFTIVEGWNRWELLQALRQESELVQTLSDGQWPEFLAELEAEYENPEGLFLPETYFLPGGSSDRDLLTQAYAAMLSALQAEWAARAESAAVRSPYEALILASIIEKETARVEERQRIAGVFTRRLGLGMRLQTDPTVIYGLLPDFDGNLTRRNMRADTVYNTYTRHGLPPTPIAMPGRDAIRAALHPADGTSLYFVATGLPDGSHKFSDTLEEHQQAVQDYLKRLRSASSGTDSP